MTTMVNTEHNWVFFFPELPLKEEDGTIVRQSPKNEYIINVHNDVS
jgi:hypothetical protein